MKASACMIALCGAALVSLSQALSLRSGAATANHTAAQLMTISKRTFMEVTLGPFDTPAKACDYCYSSFTKDGQAPAGPIAPACVCMAYPDAGGHNMFCATPVSAAGYVSKKNGCRCQARDMEAMGKTTCQPIN